MKPSFFTDFRKNPYQIWAWILALIVLVPVVTIFSSFLTPEKEIWKHLAENLLVSLISNTLVLTAGVAAVTLVLGVSLGWLTGGCDFPMRRFFSTALILPMAVPAYVMAFIFLGLMDFAGPVQTFLRTISGFEKTIIEVRTTPFIILVLGLTLYPYVYILSRTSFLNQGRATFEAARTLGKTPIQAFFLVAIPISRPWIAGGIALVTMETLADFGAVSIFNYDTFTTAIYKAWFGFFSLKAAAQLSSILVLFALILIVTESHLKSKMKYYDSSRGGAVHSRLKLEGMKGVAACIYCSVILTIAFIIPVGQLLIWILESIRDELGVHYIQLIIRTFFLGFVASLLITLAALILSFAKRKMKNGAKQLLPRIATMGYALPGTVLAVGIFLPVATLDRAIHRMSLILFNIDTAQIFQGTILVMLLAYLIRFLAVGFSSIDSGMQNIKPNLDEAASLVGVRGRKAMTRLYMPLLKKSSFTALTLILVDVIKEMPITLMTRPFGWDTLAVKIFELTSEGEWERAALPGLLLIVTGIIPVAFLTGKMEK